MVAVVVHLLEGHCVFEGAPAHDSYAYARWDGGEQGKARRRKSANGHTAVGHSERSFIIHTPEKEILVLPRNSLQRVHTALGIRPLEGNRTVLRTLLHCSHTAGVYGVDWKNETAVLASTKNEHSSEFLRAKTRGIRWTRST